MTKFRIVWSIELQKEFKVESEEEAIIEAENVDCQYNGEYVDNSFEIIKVERTGG